MPFDVRNPAALMPDRPVAPRDKGLVGGVAVAHPDSGIIAEELGRISMRPRVGEGEHRLAPVAEYRPIVAFLRAAGLARVPPDSEPPVAEAITIDNA